jgi:hypothetical protein
VPPGLKTLRPAIELMLTNWPEPWASNTGKAAATPYSRPLMLMSIILSHSSVRRADIGAMAM